MSFRRAWVLWTAVALVASAASGWSVDKLYDHFSGSPWILQMSSEVGHHGRISGDGAGVIISSGEVRPGDSHMSLTSRDLYPFVSGDYRITARLRANRQGMTSDGPYGLNFGIWDVNLDNQCQEYIVLRTGSGDGNQLSLLTSRGDRSYDVLDSTEWHTYEFRFESGSLRILIDGGEIDLLDLAGYGFPDKGYRVLASTGGRHYSPADNTVYIDWLAVESGSQTLLRIDDDKGFLWDYEMGNGYIYQEDGRLVMKNIVVKRLGNYDSVSYLLSRATFRPVTGKWRLSARMRANVQGFCNDGPYGLAVGFVDVTRRGDNLFLMPGNGDGTNLSISSNRFNRLLPSFDATSWHVYEFAFSGGVLDIRIDGQSWATENLVSRGFVDTEYRAMLQCIGRGVSNTLLNVVETDWARLEDLSVPPGMAPVDVVLRTSVGAGIANASVKYYQSSWKDLGTTDASGRLSTVLPPGSYPFRVIHEGEVNDKVQDIRVSPEVSFRTIRTTVRLRNGAGQPLDAGTVRFYAGAWRDYGVTSGGEASREMLPGAYTFRMTFEGASNDKAWNVSSSPDVPFNTVPATVRLVDSDGAPLDSGSIKFYAGSWRDFGTTSGGAAVRELLPGTCPFRMTYRGVSQDKAQAIDSATVFQTGRVLSASGLCVSYYSGAWLPFENGMELLPRTLTFRFSDGRPDKAFTLSPGVANSID